MYPPILLAWTWLLLSTTHALPVDRSPGDSSRFASAKFDDDPGILFKRGPTGKNQEEPSGPPRAESSSSGVSTGAPGALWLSGPGVAPPPLWLYGPGIPPPPRWLVDLRNPPRPSQQAPRTDSGDKPPASGPTRTTKIKGPSRPGVTPAPTRTTRRPSDLPPMPPTPRRVTRSHDPSTQASDSNPMTMTNPRKPI